MTTPSHPRPLPPDLPGPFELDVLGAAPFVKPLGSTPGPAVVRERQGLSDDEAILSAGSEPSVPGRSIRADRAALVAGSPLEVPSLPAGATTPASGAHVEDASLGTAQGDVLALARILSRVISALEPLLLEPPHAASGRRPWGATPEALLVRAREEIVQAQSELAPLIGAGSAQRSLEGRAAAAQQRADPQRSDHFGG